MPRSIAMPTRAEITAFDADFDIGGRRRGMPAIAALGDDGTAPRDDDRLERRQGPAPWPSTPSPGRRGCCSRGAAAKREQPAPASMCAAMYTRDYPGKRVKIIAAP
jgi:hypothetical protein